MYAKLNNGALQPAPKRLKHEDRIIFNPTESALRLAGYKPVRATDHPQSGDDFYFVPKYEETETEIVETWERVEFTPEPDYYDLGRKLLEGVDYEL